MLVHDPGQWHFFEDTAGIRMPDAWDQSTGSSRVVVAVLDTGIIPHRDLGLTAGRVLPGYDFFSNRLLATMTVPGSGQRSDRPGRCHGKRRKRPRRNRGRQLMARAVRDWRYWRRVRTTTLDIAGIDFNARLLPIRVLGKCGGDLSDVADAIRWAVGLAGQRCARSIQTPAKVINLSLTGAGACSQAEQSAIDAAVTAGAVVVVAAGNEGGDVASVSPANCMNVITWRRYCP